MTTFHITFKLDDFRKFDVNLILVLVMNINCNSVGTLNLKESHIIWISAAMLNYQLWYKNESNFLMLKLAQLPKLCSRNLNGGTLSLMSTWVSGSILLTRTSTDSKMCVVVMLKDVRKSPWYHRKFWQHTMLDVFDWRSRTLCPPVCPGSCSSCDLWSPRRRRSPQWPPPSLYKPLRPPSHSQTRHRPSRSLCLPPLASPHSLLWELKELKN